MYYGQDTEVVCSWQGVCHHATCIENSCALKSRSVFTRTREMSQGGTSMKKLAKELCEKVTELERMRVRGETPDLLDWPIDQLETMIRYVSDIEQWLQTCKIPIKCAAGQPGRWAQTMLAQRKFMILVLDTVPPGVIIRMLAINAQGTVLFEGYVELEAAVVQQVNAGVPRSTIAQGFVTSQEYYTNLVNGYYQHYLGRQADSSGLANAVSALSNGATNESIIAGLVISEEYYWK